MQSHLLSFFIINHFHFSIPMVSIYSPPSSAIAHFITPPGAVQNEDFTCQARINKFRGQRDEAKKLFTSDKDNGWLSCTGQFISSKVNNAGEKYESYRF